MYGSDSYDSGTHSWRVRIDKLGNNNSCTIIGVSSNTRRASSYMTSTSNEAYVYFSVRRPVEEHFGSAHLVVVWGNGFCCLACRV